MLKEGFRKISNLLKYLVFLVIGVTCTAVLIHFCFSGYFSSHEISYDEYNFPLIDAELQGKNYSLIVDLGFRFPLFLCKDTLDGIDKQPRGVGQWHTLAGQTREAPSYLIPEMRLGNLTMKNIIANQMMENTRPGHLGGFFGGEFNLLLDFPHDRIIASDTFSKLRGKKIANDDWISIPFEMHRGGIVFSVDTDFGPLRLVLKTACTLNHLRSSFFLSNAPFPSVSSSFSLEGRHFGNVKFHPIELPEILNEIDGFIGMDFLKKHAIYLDYGRKIAYVEPPESYFEHIPVTFASRGSPTISVSIEDNAYPLELDLGSSFPFSLCEKTLQNLRKISYGTAEWSDFRGQRYKSPAYTIPKIRIGNLTFDNMIIRQNREDFHVNATLMNTPLQPIGTIGLPILEKYNLFLDFQHFAIYASSDYLALRQAGLVSHNFLTIPFTLHQDGILISVETDMGIYRLILDTGATHTVIRHPHPNFTKQFCLMGCDFGSRSIIPVDLSSQFDFDGCLGLDFLREYPIFIDYANRSILLDLQYEKDKESSKSISKVDEITQVKDRGNLFVVSA